MELNLAQSICHQLTEDTFSPDLTASLIYLSFCLSDLGHNEHALKVFEETVYLQQNLAADHPDVFNSDLAFSLNNQPSMCHMTNSDQDQPK